jgi:hypothetical protein
LHSALFNETELKDIEDCITSYLLCDFGVQDVEVQAQVAAQKARVIELQKGIREILEEDK